MFLLCLGILGTYGISGILNLTFNAAMNSIPILLIAIGVDYGNPDNQTLYSESWIGGAMRWDWRPESGDWRFLTVDWPEELDEEGAVILDVDWDDNPFTDIDVMWLTEAPHEYYDDDPEAYGPSTFFIEERSVNNQDRKSVV